MNRSTSVALLAVVLAGAHCAAQAVTPSIQSLNPNPVAAGSGAFSLTVNGTNFQPGAAVLWNGSALPTSYLGATQLIGFVQAGLTFGQGSVTVAVSNPGGVLSNTVVLTISAPPINITTTALPAGAVGVPYTFTLTVTGGVQPYSWSSTGNMPAGLTLSANGTITGTPTASGSFTIGVRVADSLGTSTTQSLALTIAGLTITATSPLPGGTATLPYSQTFTATSGTPPLSWSTTGTLPPGLSMSAAGTLSGTPSADGSYNFAVQVSDANHQTATQNYALTIKPAPLTITTVPPLFDGIAGTLYSQTFAASGGVKPYRWSVLSGNTGDLKLDSTTGTVQGTPQSAGTLTFTVQVTDAVATKTSATYTITIRPPSLTIVTGATLPPGTVGVDYNQQFSVVGGTAPYTWQMMTGSVSGLRFDTNQVLLAGNPDTPGSFTFTLQARDSANLTVTRSFNLVINPAVLLITTSTLLPDGVLGAAYRYQMSASGGVPPYTWSATGLPSGLSIDANTGTITGTMGAAEPASFAVRVVDSARLSTTNQFRINVALPRVPTVRVTGLPGTLGAAQQFTLQIALDSSFPAAISGQAILAFSPEVGGGDGTIQFASGGTTAAFTIPAGETAATVSPALAIQTGTVAGQISISLRLQTGGLDVTPAPAPTVSAHIDQAAPVIQSAKLVRSGNGFSIQIAGYSTAREVTQAVFTFSAASGQTLQSSQVTIPVDTLFGKWYQDTANNSYGSQFVFTQPFTIQGDASAVLPQSVTLVNRKGSVSADIVTQ